MNKNQGHFQAFTESWFKKHQRGLLFLCNAPVIKYWFRYVLRIHKYDCPIDVKITELAPNRFSYGDRIIFDVKDKKLKRERTTDFRTHDKFSKRIYFAFKPMWWAFHAWDWLIADRWIPAWSFQFSTLTQYPGSIGTDNPVDGYMYQNTAGGLTWANLVAAAGSAASYGTSSDNIIYFQSNDGTANWITLLRSIYCFDTSALTAAATISAATMSLYGTNKSDTFTTPAAPDINIYSSAPAATNALVAGDFDSLGTTAFSDTAVSYASWSTSAYNDFTFNASGIGGISKTGITKTGARNANHDVANSSPTFANNKSAELDGYFSNQTGTSSDPKLVVTYTSSSIKSFNGLAAASVKSVNGLAIASVKSKNGLA